MVWRMTSLAALTLLIASGPGSAQDVVTDGGTATSVVTQSSGRVVIGIAPSTGGVSLNTFDRFSVGDPGVALDNRTVAANVIVNQVTSAEPSRIEGVLEVLGNSARVVVANPNGIRVNGGRFVNTGTVALITGTTQFDGTSLTAEVAGGDISVGPAGLSGTISELDLLARTIRLEEDAQLATDGLVSIAAGDNTFLLDGSSALRPFARLTSSQSRTATEFVVDVAGGALLNAGRVSITVTSQGAGVRMRGDAATSQGSFRLTSAGRLEVSGSSVEAEGTLDLRASGVAISGAEGVAAGLTSNTSGVVLVSTETDVRIGGTRIEGQIIASDTLASEGAVTVFAERDLLLDADDGGSGTAILARDNNLALFAGRDLRFEQATLETGASVTGSGDGVADLSETTVTAVEDIRVRVSGNATVTGSALSADGDIRLDAASILVGERDNQDLSETRTTVRAATGGVVLRSTSGEVRNSGGLIQGQTRSAGDALSIGGVSIVAATDLVNESISSDRLAVIFSGGDDLTIAAGSDILNRTGRIATILVAGDPGAEDRETRLVAGGLVVNETVRSAGGGVERRRVSGGGLFGRFLPGQRKVEIAASYGDATIRDPGTGVIEIAQIASGGDLTVNATGFRNLGGFVLGRGVAVDATDTIVNETLITGSYSYRQSCFLVCNAAGQASVGSLPASILAQNAMTLVAGSGISNLGGVLSGLDNLSLTAPRVTNSDVRLPLLIERPSGATAFFRGRQVWLSDVGLQGLIESPIGTVSIVGDLAAGNAVVLSDGDIQHQGEVVPLAAGSVRRTGRIDIGVFSGIF